MENTTKSTRTGWTVEETQEHDLTWRLTIRNPAGQVVDWRRGVDASFVGRVRSEMLRSAGATV